MIKTAVILAAGLGSRLGSLTKDKPKGFIKLGDKPIIEESIIKLLGLGIEKIIIGTGYHKEFYEKLASKYPQIRCISNQQYKTTGSLYTLYTLKNEIVNDFILLESDLIYEKRMISRLLQIKEKDMLLADHVSNNHDQVFIERNDSLNLVNLSKNKNKLSRIDGQFIGINKISYSTFLILMDLVKSELVHNPLLEYEEGLVILSKLKNLFVYKINDLLWYEIDDKIHLSHASSTIYPAILKRDSMWPIIKRNILLNPGPATTSDYIKFAQVVPDICPREEEFSNVLKFISHELTRFVANTNHYTTVLFGGSGTAAVEAILSSVVKTSILIINNGAYGERMCQIAKSYQLPLIELKSPADQPINIELIEQKISNSSTHISHLAIVHHETSTGLLNNIEIIGKLCKKYNIELIVDAMSSYAAIPIDMVNMNISYLAASSNKNLQGMAGISFVIAKKDNLKESKNIKPKNYYLHLYSQFEFLNQKAQMRFTPPVQTLYALKEAIIETKKEGIKERYERYQQSWQVLIKGITDLGLSYLVSNSAHSKLVTAIIEPHHPQFDFNALHDFLYEKGVTIYPGKINQLKTFRIANIGAIDKEDIYLFLRYLNDYLQKIGYFNL